MAYNNGFPVNYPYMVPPSPYMPPSQPAPLASPAPQAAPTQQMQNIIWVSGEAGAKAYLVAPNTSVPLWDSDAQVIYLKSADASGKPTTKILDYTIREQQAGVPALMQDPVPEYVTKGELAKFEEKMQKQLDKLSNKRKPKEEEDDE